MSEVARPEQPNFRETLIDVGRWVASSGVAGADVVAAEIERALATPAKVETLDMADIEDELMERSHTGPFLSAERYVKASDVLEVLRLAKDPSPGGSDE